MTAAFLIALSYLQQNSIPIKSAKTDLRVKCKCTFYIGLFNSKTRVLINEPPLSLTLVPLHFLYGLSHSSSLNTYYVPEYRLDADVGPALMVSSQFTDLQNSNSH